MSIDSHPGRKPLLAPVNPPWGMVAEEGTFVRCLRFVLPDRTVTYAADQLTRWEHRLGDNECLSLQLGAETVHISGSDLGPIRGALDQSRLAELRPTPAHESNARPGPRIHRITIESTMKHGQEIPSSRPTRLPRRPSP